METHWPAIRAKTLAQIVSLDKARAISRLSFLTRCLGTFNTGVSLVHIL